MFTVEDHVKGYEKALSRMEFLGYEMEAQGILGYLPKGIDGDFVWKRSVFYEEYLLQIEIGMYNFQRVVEMLDYQKARELMPRG